MLNKLNSSLFYPDNTLKNETYLKNDCMMIVLSYKLNSPEKHFKIYIFLCQQSF